jgi:DNA-directed RNA polymerase subunit N (RpoN/RPB10)
MLIPIRCFSCNNILADKYTTFIEEKEKNEKTLKQILDDLKLQKYCCRTIMLTHINMIKNLS